MEKDIMIIEGVRGYEKDDVVYVHLYDVAMGLGITEIKNGIKYIRWERVRKYLEELGLFITRKKLQNAYIPENVFYRLAMKTKNKIAREFQIKLSEEITKLKKEKKKLQTKIKSDRGKIVEYYRFFYHNKVNKYKFS